MSDIQRVVLSYGASAISKKESWAIKKAIDRPMQKRPQGRRGRTGDKTVYRDLICSFDIETTQYHPLKQAIMYVWQFGIGTDLVVVGRTWTQFKYLLHKIKSGLKENEKQLVFVHNLSYEFQFLAGVFPFAPADVFCMDSRKVARALLGNHFEFRCSYILTNMSLAELTNKMDVEHKKLSGEEFDYSKQRFPWTELKGIEMEYPINDVIGLNEALYKFIAIEKDSFYTLPLTSTGFVRRDVKKKVRMLSHQYMVGIQPDLRLYKMLREAFRGGDTHANRYFIDSIIFDVKSADRSSSYPDVICNREFPGTKWSHVGFQDLSRIKSKMEHHYALLMRVIIRGNIHLRDPYWGFPYIPISKCKGIKHSQCVMDNGRILSTEGPIEMVITDIDLKIILFQYDFDEILFLDVYMSRYKKLPLILRQTVARYYKNKTELKNVEGQETFYMKQKSRLNSIYGMMVQNVLRPSILFNQGQTDEEGHLSEWSIDDSKTEEEILSKYSAQGFLPYFWGVWVTAWARYELQEGLKLVDPKNAIYVDTDSIKYIGDVDFSGYNAERIENSTHNKAFATDPKGITHYMGVYETEDTSDKFITQGAKKYCCEIHGKIKLTCAGVGKKIGAKELEEAGGIEQFRDGFTFYKAGGIKPTYNDNVDKWIRVDGHRLHITRNVYFEDDVYTLGKTADYVELVKRCKFLLQSVLKRNKMQTDAEASQK